MGTGGVPGRKKEAYNEHKPIDIDIVIELRKAICKIIVYKEKVTFYGTGFFMKGPDSNIYLMTNYHVIDLDSLKDKIELEIWNKKIITLNGNNINGKFLKDPKDITALEIKESNNYFEEVNFLNYDKNYEDGDSTYEDADVFTIEHPIGKNAKCSSGKIINISEYEFDHNIATESGSSGCPILLLNDNIKLIKVIGIHKNGDKKTKINGGTFIGEIINELKNDLKKDLIKSKVIKNYIIAEIYIDEGNVNKDIRIINSYEEYMRTQKHNDPLDKDRMNEKDIKECEIKINGELIQFNYYYQFKKKGKYYIEYSFKNYSIKVNDIFNKCECLNKVDLSNFNVIHCKNVSLMFNGCDKLKEIKGMNKFITNKFKTIKNNFNIRNNTIPIVNTMNSQKHIKKEALFALKEGFQDEGYQILVLKKNTLIGVLEGPPNTPFENGYFLFKILFPEYFPFPPPTFIFITKVFHPNISEKGIVSVDILQDQWQPAIWPFGKTIISIQSLLDDPNPHDFLNEKAAKLFIKDRNIYNETVRGYTSLFANYSKFLEDINNMNIQIKINEGADFKCTEENNN